MAYKDMNKDQKVLEIIDFLKSPEMVQFGPPTYSYIIHHCCILWPGMKMNEFASILNDLMFCGVLEDGVKFIVEEEESA